MTSLAAVPVQSASTSRPISDPLAHQNLRLAIQREVVTVAGDQHMRDRRFGRHAALDQAERRRRLPDATRSTAPPRLTSIAGVARLAAAGSGSA
jgi:hypothetical protein